MLFGRFKETVFTKRGSELGKKLNALEELKKEYPDNEDLDREYKLVSIGLKGEREIEDVLRNADIGMYVLHDIILQIDNIKTQIDYVIITPAYVYLIECKSLIGNIIIEEDGQFYKEIHSEDKLIRQSMSSPVKKAEMNKEILKRVLDRRKNVLRTSLLDESEEEVYDYYRSLVIMPKTNGILKLYLAPEDVKGKVVMSNDLIEYFKNDIKIVKMMDRSNLLSQKQMKEFSDDFLLMTLQNNRDYKKHYKDAFELGEK